MVRVDFNGYLHYGHFGHFEDGHYGNDLHRKRPLWELAILGTVLMGNGHFGTVIRKQTLWETPILGTDLMGNSLWETAIL